MLVIFIIRTLQLLFAGAVLGLSIHAWMWQEYGPVPGTTVFAALAGGFTILVGLVGVIAGIIAFWISVIPDFIMSIMDGIASIFLLAAGIVSPSQYLLPSTISANNRKRLPQSRSPTTSVASKEH